jgi:hypothetical protein
MLAHRKASSTNLEHTMNLIDNYYDAALRNVVPNELYDDSANLHLIGAQMDNAAADRAEDSLRAAEYREASIAIFGFVL